MLNAGSNAALPLDSYDLDKDGDLLETLPVDITGFPRVFNTAVDVGAYENRPPLYAIGGTVTGLHVGNYLLLKNNSDEKIITENEPYVFDTTIYDGQGYAVTIELQPNNPIQSCVVNNPNGQVTGTPVIDANVVCEFGDDLIFRGGFE